MVFRAGARIGDELVELEGVCEASTTKARLICFTNTDTKVWVPKSQIVAEMEIGDTTVYHIKEWFCKKEGLI